MAKEIYKIRVLGVKEVVGSFEELSIKTVGVLRDSLDQLGETISSEMKLQAGKNSRTGELESSIDYDVDSLGLKVAVGPDDTSLGTGKAYAGLAIESGRNQGSMPPYDQIANRYGLDNRDAFAVALAISKKRIDGQYFVESTYDNIDNEIDRISQDILNNIVSSF